MQFSSEGISPDPKKIDALQNMSQPENVSQCRSLLGMTNYVSRFIQNYSTLTAPIRKLLKQDTAFHWGPEQENALRDIKQALASQPVMAYFDPCSESELHVDASPHGVAGMLMQNGKVVAYGSKSLTETEQRYSQIEREMYAIAWSCVHFRLFLLGKHFSVYTDHKPLLSICNNPSKKASARIENWLLKLQGYDFDVLYRPGKDNPADYMSRHANPGSPSIVTKSGEEYVNMITNTSKPNALNLNEIQDATASDSTLQCVFQFIQNDKWDLNNLPFPDANINALKVMKTMRYEFASDDGKLLLRNARLVIPEKLQQCVIELAHGGHQGHVKTKKTKCVTFKDLVSIYGFKNR